MSDDFGEQNQQPGGMAPAPPPPPPGTFAPAPAPQAPVQPGGPVPAQPPKKRTGLIVAIIAIVVICGIVGCAAAAIGFGMFGQDDSKAAVETAETHYNAAMESVEVASGWMDGLESGAAGTDDVTAAIEDSTKAIRTARDELAAAAAAVEGLEDSEGKTAYVASIEQATIALDGIEDLLAYVQKASGMADLVSDAGAAGKKATASLNDAISAGNARKYTKMRSEAKDAAASYAKAAVLFDQAHKVDPSAGLDKAAKYVRKRKQQADVVVEMASDGKAGRASAYNKKIKTMNKLGAQAEKIGEPAIVSDPNWLQSRLAELNTSVNDAAAKADELHASALVALGFSK